MEYTSNIFRKGVMKMLMKFENWCNKPWTNGTYVKLCAIVMAVYAVMVGIAALYVYGDRVACWIKKPFVKVKSLFRG